LTLLGIRLMIFSEKNKAKAQFWECFNFVTIPHPNLICEKPTKIAAAAAR